MVLAAVGSAVFADDPVPTVAEVTHMQLQAVNQNGIGTYAATDKVTLQGIVINTPEEMLDPAPGDADMGGQWQMYIQGEGNDHASTAVWFGQNYSVVTGGEDYTEQTFLDELCRINRDPNTNYVFTVGDRVKVTGWYKFYKGKTNVNEKHEVGSFFDFSIELVTPGAGLPMPELITLAELVDKEGNFIFDPNRLAGCEYYQGRRVRVEDVQITNPETWGPEQILTIADPNGREFPVLLGRGEGFSRYACPTRSIDVVGILDQEASDYFPCKDGYRIWVTNYDGNGLLLSDRGYRRGNLPGDVHADFIVDLQDLADVSENWLRCVPGLHDCP